MYCNRSCFSTRIYILISGRALYPSIDNLHIDTSRFLNLHPTLLSVPLSTTFSLYKISCYSLVQLMFSVLTSTQVTDLESTVLYGPMRRVSLPPGSLTSTSPDFSHRGSRLFLFQLFQSISRTDSAVGLLGLLKPSYRYRSNFSIPSLWSPQSVPFSNDLLFRTLLIFYNLLCPVFFEFIQSLCYLHVPDLRSKFLIFISKNF